MISLILKYEKVPLCLLILREHVAYNDYLSSMAAYLFNLAWLQQAGLSSVRRPLVAVVRDVFVLNEVGFQ